jgi:class I fructose-bisphosphate aldolase
MEHILEQVAEGRPDAIMLMQGMAERCFDPYAGRINLILKCSSLSPYHPQQDVQVSGVEDALRLGADAIAMAVTVGSPRQPSLMSSLADLVREAAHFGLPVIAHAYPNGDLVPKAEQYSAERVAYAARMVAELGVDIVKTFYTGSAESFAQVVEAAAPVWVVAAGGPKMETESDVFQTARAVVESGAAGITFGRNVWQSSDPGLMVDILGKIIHQGMAPEEALQLWRREGAC